MNNEDFAGKYSLTVYETVKYIGICERKVREMVKNDQIPYYRVGRSVRIPLDELNIWLRNGGTRGGLNV